MADPEEVLHGLTALRVLAPQHRIALSADGSRVAYATRLAHGEAEPSAGFYPTGAPVAARGCEVHVTDTASGATAIPLPMTEGRSWRPSWAPDGRSLAFYADRGGAVHLHIWRPGQGRPRAYGEAVVRCRGFGGDRPRWAADGRSVHLPLCPTGLEGAFRGAEPRSGPALVLRSGDTATDARSLWRADLGVIDVASGEVRRLVTDLPAAEPHPSPDGRRIAFHMLARGDPQGCDLYVVTAEGGEPGPVAVGLHGSSQWRHQPAWHPDGTALAFLRNGRPYVWRVAADAAAPWGAAPADPADERYVAWTPDGRGLLLRDRGGGLWACPADGREAVRLDVRAAGRPLQPADSDAAAGDATFVLVPSDGGLLRVPLDGGAPAAVWRDQAAVEAQAFSNTWNWWGDATRDGGTAVFARETCQRPADLWVARGTAARQLTALNPDVASVVSARTLSFSLPEARPSDGLLWTPGGRARPWPTVVVLHPDLRPSAAVHRFEPEVAAGFAAQYLTALGFALWMPDFDWPSGDEDRGERLAADVTAAVDAAVAGGWADPSRLALAGYGLGAYAVHALMVRTRRFAAAVSTAGIVNFTASHGRLGVWQGAPDIEAARRSEGLLGRKDGPWADPAWYVRNSPLFRLDAAATPLLLLAGRGAAPESEALFAGLCRLGITAEFARYPDEEGEAPFHWRAEAFADAARRVGSWLRRWLGD